MNKRSTSVATSVTTWYFEMLSPEALRPKRFDPYDLSIQRMEIPCPEFGRFLYTSVGGPWYWCDRLSWNYADWQRHLERPEVEIWTAWMAGTPAGYVELESQAQGNVEIAYFGLLPLFMGQGLGGYLLTVGTQEAWSMPAQRVWVHTCSLDGPQAYHNYEARGFTLYHTETTVKPLPPQPPGPWPNSGAPHSLSKTTDQTSGKKANPHKS
ncbi:MAG: hypothetical protein RLZZ597_396 [Cyanobacteriota bacterium]|jgi:hypothetical protein